MSAPAEPLRSGSSQCGDSNKLPQPPVRDKTKVTKKDASFAALGLNERLVATLTELGYEEPTPIQREAIPLLLSGRDVVGQAATGTGKTAAFSLPLIQTLAAAGKTGKKGAKGDTSNSPQALILVPTRELAMQVADAVHRYGRDAGVSVLPIYGGQPYGQQIRALERGVDVVVATPGRALDHVRRQTLRLAGVKTVVLDEADEMLDMGFVEDIESLLEATGEERQIVLFSATLPPRIAGIAKRYLNDPLEIKIERERPVAGEVPRVRQLAYLVPRSQKLAALTRLLDVENPSSAIIFCRTRLEVDEVADRLNARGHRAEPLHGGMSQVQRDRVMKKLRKGEADLVVATDVAARGLDVEQLSHVFNFDVPSSAEAYVHRIGRVGRAGREGVAIVLAEPREHRQLRNFERAAKQKIIIEQVPSVADLRARRIDITRASLHELVIAGGNDSFRIVVETLANEFDLMEIAAAAVRLAHESQEGGERMDEPEDIRSYTAPPAERSDQQAGPKGRGPGRQRTQDRSKKGQTAGMVRLYVGVGRTGGVRPQDLVGAIAGEAGINGRMIGAIDIADRFSLVEVVSDVADQVIEALHRTRIKGKKVTARRDIPRDKRA